MHLLCLLTQAIIPGSPDGSIMARADELILRTRVIQFDGRVAGIFGSSAGDVIRCHVALLKEPQVHAPDRKGRRLVTTGTTSFGVDPDGLQRLEPLLSKIAGAVRTARNGTD
jgi:hypothetical protein